MGDRWLRQSEANLFQRIAFVTRYTSNDLNVAMAIPLRDLIPYCDASAELIEQENRVTPSATGK